MWFSMNDEEKIEIESAKKWIGRWLLDISPELLVLNPVPEVRRLPGGEKDDRKTRAMPGELAVSKEHKVPADMVKFARKRYGDDVVIYMRDEPSNANGEGVFYLIKLIEGDGSKNGRPVGIAEIRPQERRDDSKGKVDWFVRESKVARDRWKDMYQQLFIAQHGEKALDKFLNRD